jgi:D-glucosaminate-6-phosphate ammonia-lyase
MTSLFGSLKFEPIINAAGPTTPHGGSPIAADITLAMAAAAEVCVDIGELQGSASEIIAACTGAEAGIVTSGAAAGLLLGAAACMAGLDPARMGSLPDPTGMPHEFVVPRSHRNSYDHAVRSAGARLVEVGVADRLVGVGVRDTEVWEIESAITASTAGVLYVARPDARPLLAQVAAAAHRAGVPVLVDAAAELPPAANLRRFVADGADLVVFSGGKALGGPSASGILCGRRRLVASALLQQLDLDFEFDAWQPPRQIIDKNGLIGVPRNGIGRPCKVGKEQIVGLIEALTRFTATDDEVRRQPWIAIARALVASLSTLPVLEVRAVSDTDGRGVPLVEVCIPGNAGPDATEVARRLRAASPSVRVDASRAHAGILILVPTCLRSDDPERIGLAFAGAMARP